MTSPLAVLLIIGQLTLGPFHATEAELAEWADVRAHTVITSDNGWVSYSLGTWRGKGDAHAMMFSDQAMLCRRVMTEAGIGWRLSLTGDIGWMTSTEKDWLGHDKAKQVEVTCATAPADFRAHLQDMNFPDEATASCPAGIRIDERIPEPCVNGKLVSRRRHP